MITKIRTIEELINDTEDCPIDIADIPNKMGINLSSVSNILWERLPDGQLNKLTIQFKPENKMQSWNKQKQKKEDMINMAAVELRLMGYNVNVDADYNYISMDTVFGIYKFRPFVKTYMEAVYSFIYGYALKLSEWARISKNNSNQKTQTINWMPYYDGCIPNEDNYRNRKVLCNWDGGKITTEWVKYDRIIGDEQRRYKGYLDCLGAPQYWSEI